MQGKGRRDGSHRRKKEESHGPGIVCRESYRHLSGTVRCLAPIVRRGGVSREGEEKGWQGSKKRGGKKGKARSADSGRRKVRCSMVSAQQKLIPARILCDLLIKKAAAIILRKPEGGMQRKKKKRRKQQRE